MIIAGKQAPLENYLRALPKSQKEVKPVRPDERSKRGSGKETQATQNQKSKFLIICNGD